jgi:hypothetical protein
MAFASTVILSTTHIRQNPLEPAAILGSEYRRTHDVVLLSDGSESIFVFVLRGNYLTDAGGISGFVSYPRNGKRRCEDFLSSHFQQIIVSLS